MEYAYTERENDYGDDVYHYAWCKHVNQMSSQNRRIVEMSAYDLVKEQAQLGVIRRPCEDCEPPLVLVQ